MSRHVDIVGKKKTVYPLKRARDEKEDEQGRVSKREKRELSCIRRDKKDASDPGSSLVSSDCSCDEDHNTYDCARRPINWPTLSDLPRYSFSVEEEESKRESSDSSYEGVDWSPRRFDFDTEHLPDYSGDDDSSSSPVRPSYSDEEEAEEESKRESSDSSYEYSPLRPSFSTEEEDDDSREEDKEEEITFERVFFAECGGIPFLYQSGDRLILDPTMKIEGDRMVMIMEDRDERRNLFSRDIRSYENGSLVSKHCAPWGNVNILHNNVFRILSKVFSVTGDVSYVIIREVSGLVEREFFIEPAFFAGWLNLDDDAYEKFCRTKSM